MQQLMCVDTSLYNLLNMAGCKEIKQTTRYFENTRNRVEKKQNKAASIFSLKEESNLLIVNDLNSCENYF